MAQHRTQRHRGNSLRVLWKKMKHGREVVLIKGDCTSRAATMSDHLPNNLSAIFTVWDGMSRLLLQPFWSVVSLADLCRGPSTFGSEGVSESLPHRCLFGFWQHGGWDRQLWALTPSPLPALLDFPLILRINISGSQFRIPYCEAWQGWHNSL